MFRTCFLKPLHIIADPFKWALIPALGITPATPLLRTSPTSCYLSPHSFLFGLFAAFHFWKTTGSPKFRLVSHLISYRGLRPRKRKWILAIANPLLLPSSIWKLSASLMLNNFGAQYLHLRCGLRSPSSQLHGSCYRHPCAIQFQTAGLALSESDSFLPTRNYRFSLAHSLFYSIRISSPLHKS